MSNGINCKEIINTSASPPSHEAKVAVRDRTSHDHVLTVKSPAKVTKATLRESVPQ